MLMKTKDVMRCAGRLIQRFLDVRFPVNVACGRTGIGLSELDRNGRNH